MLHQQHADVAAQLVVRATMGASAGMREQSLYILCLCSHRGMKNANFIEVTADWRTLVEKK